MIDTNTNMVVDTIAVPVERPQPEIGRFSYVHDVAVSPDGRYVYVTGTAGSGFTSTDGTVSVIDTTTHAVQRTLCSRNRRDRHSGQSGWKSAICGNRVVEFQRHGDGNRHDDRHRDRRPRVLRTTQSTGRSHPDGKRLYMIAGAQGEAEMAEGAVMVIDTDPLSDTYNPVIAGSPRYDLGTSASRRMSSSARTAAGPT